MRFAYADPPYPGQARRLYGGHPDYAGEVDHAELIAELERDYDGWALSTSAQALQRVLALCPEGENNPKRPGTTKEGTGVRILVWTKPMTSIWPGTLPYGWEPVILRNPRRRATYQAGARDTLDASPEGFTWRERPPDHVIGAKPPAFCRWLFECAGLQPDDEFVDLFAGSGAVAAEWERWRSQPELRQLRHPATLKAPRRDAALKGHPQLDGLEPDADEPATVQGDA